jgi:hypothetical protein
MEATLYAYTSYIFDDIFAMFDRDVGGVTFAKSTYALAVDNEMYHNEMDAVQSVGGNENDYEFNHHKYVGRNIGHHNLQTGFWTKNSADIIFPENIAYGSL